MRFLTSIGVLTMSVAMMTFGCATDSVHADEQTAQTAVGKMLDIEETAWNSGDAATYANEYTDDADFINIRGQVFAGKPAVQQQHEKIFGGPFKGSVITITVRKLTLLAKGMALVDTDQTVTNFKGLPLVSSHRVRVLWSRTLNTWR